MTEEDMTFADPLAGEELERTLARYARLRLDPSQAQSRRARTAVMEAAWRQHFHPEPIERTAVPAAAAGRHGHVPFSGWSARRVSVSFAAAAIAGLMLGTSVFAGSRAGGPLYESRLALESLTLPADADARVAAQVAQADARLGEAVEAAFRHDDRATAAALGAYDRTIEDLTTAEGAAATEALEAIQQHRDVLLQLAAQVSDDAATGIETALASSSRVIDRLGGAGNDGDHGSTPTGPSGAGGVNGEPQGGGSGTGGTNGEPKGGGSGAGGTNGEPKGGSGANSGQGGAKGQGPDDNNGGQGGNGQKPAATPAPTPQATSEPAKTPKPRRTPPGDVAPTGAPVSTPDHP